MDYLKSHKKQLSWFLIGGAIVSGTIVVNAAESGYVETGELASDNALEETGIKLSAGNETESNMPSLGTIPPPTETEILPEVTDDNLTSEAMVESVVEVTPSILDLVTHRYIEETLEMAENLNLPLPVERLKNIKEADKIRRLEGYKDYFREMGQKDEYWLDVGARGLYAYDNIKNMNGNLGSFADYLSRNDFIIAVAFGFTKDFLCDKDGHPVIPLAGFTDRMKEALVVGIDLLEEGGAKNVYESIRDSGASFFLAAELQPGAGAGAALFNQWGILNFNMSEENTKIIKDEKFPLFFAINIPPETIGISFDQITVALGLYPGFIRDRLAHDNSEIVKNVEGGIILLGIDSIPSSGGKNTISQADDYTERYGLSVNSGASVKKRLQFQGSECYVKRLCSAVPAGTAH